MALRKPKAKKFPKQPKANASADSWRKYTERCKAIEADNKKAQADYERDVKAREASKKAVAKIKSGR